MVSLDYTQHPSAAAALRRVRDRGGGAARRDPPSPCEHRVGHLEVGDLAVVVAVGAEHRGAALDACRDLIDTLKTEVPIWKEQHFVEGGTQWIGLPDAADDASTAAGPDRTDADHPDSDHPHDDRTLEVERR